MSSVSYVQDLRIHVQVFVIGITTGMDPAASDAPYIADLAASEVENVSLVVNKLLAIF